MSQIEKYNKLIDTLIRIYNEDSFLIVLLMKYLLNNSTADFRGAREYLANEKEECNKYSKWIQECNNSDMLRYGH